MINQYLLSTVRVLNTSCGKSQGLRPPVKCADDFTVSVQASESHYCTPRQDGVVAYTEVEMAFPNMDIPEYLEVDGHNIHIGQYYDGSIYTYVPTWVVDALIQSHGGLVK